MSGMRPLTIIVGTRPEAIKLRPVIDALKARGVPLKVLSTGQHTTLLDGTGLHADQALGCPATGDPLGYADDLIEILHDALVPGSVVLVQGDTASAYAGALAGHAKDLPVVHVECGIRTGDLANPWPEEGFRIAIDRRATVGYAAHANHAANAVVSNPDLQVLVTGNPGVDACLAIAKCRPIGLRGRTILVTLHRRESFGEPLQQIYDGLVCFAREHPEYDIRWPLHPNPAIRKCFRFDHGLNNLGVIDPLPHRTFVKLLGSATAVLTDSGGVQEDASVLGIPCVVAREVTDRPETIETGHAVLAGRTRAGILRGLLQATGSMMRTDSFTGYGSGQAAQRIADHLAAWL